jgi:hypothetical protein
LVECETVVGICNLEVAGSIPAGRTFKFLVTLTKNVHSAS